MFARISGSRPIPALADDTRVCFRCGAHFHAPVSSSHLVAGAPCRDCREYLAREEGETTAWDDRRPNAGVRTWMTAEERAEERSKQIARDKRNRRIRERAAQRATATA